MRANLPALQPIGAWIVRHVVDWGAHASVAIRHALVHASRQSGIPVVVLSAIALVVAVRLFRKTTRLVLEFAVALAFVAAMTKLGWIRW